MKPGADLAFPSDEVAQQWKTGSLNPALRWVLFTAAGIYFELGANRCRVLRLMGPDFYAYGNAADIAPTDLPGVQSAAPGDDYPLPGWVAQRLNLLFPGSDLDTATYNGARIVLRVPSNPAKMAQWGAEWTLWGPTGKRVLQPQRRLKIDRDGRREVL